MKSFNTNEGKIAYFTMEIGLNPQMNTYSGGLGILSGDVIRSFADLEVPAVGVTQLNDRGYCKQILDEEGNQVYSEDVWNPEDYLERLSVKTSVEIEGKKVDVGAWQEEAESEGGFSVPVLFLDTNLEGNPEEHQNITSCLYRGDQKRRLKQEIVLGIGGARILKELDYEIRKYHMNESHSSLLTLELLKRYDMNRESVRDRCVFTTHTPESSGHDRFSYDLVKEVLGEFIPIKTLKDLSREEDLHMTLLALNLSGYANAVSKRHEEVTKEMFPGFPIDSITNGVHSSYWTSDSFKKLYDEYIPGWRKDHYKLKYAVRIPGEKIWKAHLDEKEKLIDYVNKKSDVEMNERVFTIGFARRATPYKRADLIFQNPDQLVKIDKEVGDFQIIFAGKPHPEGEESKKMIKKIKGHINDLKDNIEMTYLEDYDMGKAALMTSGADLWLNNPERGREACGTSGMKAACNGIPQLSTLDGWWIEGYIEDVTGWKIGSELGEKQENDRDVEANELYEKLTDKIIPTFYSQKKKWTQIMRNTIAHNASFFNAHRMVREYILNAF
ncbi:hypothetical protein AKJ51_01890 [candidate division MSBL1 archaeon SCGC-AAA382A20]|uniref:Alpha-glucan phosphorylase n=1 Tax=candidate division MSBL1 archaeon SCGC-AAA382A20 TaxID=1698280 RepID=A0A133VL76_9EURY|nr:hypothetical protein AKJ51_01890 [candidate division MSBL1 archaeon SCGC-AAA382A20]